MYRRENECFRKLKLFGYFYFSDLAEEGDPPFSVEGVSDFPASSFFDSLDMVFFPP